MLMLEDQARAASHRDSVARLNAPDDGDAALPRAVAARLAAAKADPLAAIKAATGSGTPVSCYLSVIIPAYNEEQRLPATLVRIAEYLELRDFSYELIVVDDGSRDGTRDVVRDFAAT